MSQFSSHVLSSLYFFVAILCILSNSSVVFINYSTKHHKVRLTLNKIQEKSSKHPISTVKYKDTQPHWEYQSLIQIDVYPWHFQPLTFKQISSKCNERLLKQSAMLFQVPVLLWDNFLIKNLHEKDRKVLASLLWDETCEVPSWGVLFIISGFTCKYCDEISRTHLHTSDFFPS